jgi:hypothetical protein
MRAGVTSAALSSREVAIRGRNALLQARPAATEHVLSAQASSVGS